jgi:hypothetical protein
MSLHDEAQETHYFRERQKKQQAQIEGKDQLGRKKDPESQGELQ